VSAAVVGVTSQAHLEEILDLATKPRTAEAAFVQAFS
jgi:hypothetical protein